MAQHPLLGFFDPDATVDFIVEKQQERGINCRFGMAGGIAEAYFDPTRNWLVHLAAAPDRVGTFSPIPTNALT
jgi:hypothetical protein